MGTELLATGSILAAFFVGGVALFGAVLHRLPRPSYLGRRGEEHAMATAAADLRLPCWAGVRARAVTVGVSLIAGAIAKYHGPLCWAGGLLMIALGASALTGRMWSMPSFLRAPDTARGDSATFSVSGSSRASRPAAARPCSRVS